MSAVAEKPKKILLKQIEIIARDFFLYSIWVNNIFINVKDIIPKDEVLTS